MFKSLMGLLVCVAVMASPALAGGGGGGAKKDANIKVVHDISSTSAAPDVVYAVADPPLSLINKLIATPSTATVKDLTNAGGVAVKRGKSAIIPVKAGTVPLFGCILNSSGKLTIVGEEDVTVAKGKTVEVKASKVLSSGT